MFKIYYDVDIRREVLQQMLSTVFIRQSTDCMGANR